MLLRFKVANHRSLRDPTVLTLTRPSLRTNVPMDGNWVGATSRVAGIYGANASGKSTLLHALNFVGEAVQYSASHWADGPFPYFPFALEKKMRESDSEYELDIVVNEVRYTYGFQSSHDGISREWLYSYPNQRRKTLFERDPVHDGGYFFGRSLQGENQTVRKLTEPHNLFLSVAGRAKHSTLGKIYEYISHNLRYAAFTHYDQSNRMSLVKRVLEDKVLLKKTEALLRFADMGIAGIALENEELDARLQEVIRNFAASLTEPPDEETITSTFEELKKQVFFQHFTESGSTPAKLSLDDESAGTTAWLSLSVPALLTIEMGGVFLVDELDSSMHTKLCAALISLFKDPDINQTGAQLIFTSHDVSLLGRIGGNVLKPDEVWFTEKTFGATEIFSLHEFQTRERDNFEKRYLEGRYGAVPMIEIDQLKADLVYANAALDSEE
ncbi:ATP-binding protein [Amycolatopsis roodepoortensis]|uniref:AAA family ATPase n=1 Tax=Amycolatopsis roodepoortensis TaxID=700274 RepID=UPI00214B223E|nr:ATP-binding protein [Amycolatopsis roodepoortensis]UUV34315.1 ATP-binding protein [Amycolatopsis roodepoortensis]